MELQPDNLPSNLKEYQDSIEKHYQDISMVVQETKQHIEQETCLNKTVALSLDIMYDKVVPLQQQLMLVMQKYMQESTLEIEKLHDLYKNTSHQVNVRYDEYSVQEQFEHSQINKRIKYLQQHQLDFYEKVDRMYKSAPQHFLNELLYKHDQEEINNSIKGYMENNSIPQHIRKYLKKFFTKDIEKNIPKMLIDFLNKFRDGN